MFQITLEQYNSIHHSRKHFENGKRSLFATDFYKLISDSIPNDVFPMDSVLEGVDFEISDLKENLKTYSISGINKEFLASEEIEAISPEEAQSIYKTMWNEGEIASGHSEILTAEGDISKKKDFELNTLPTLEELEALKQAVDDCIEYFDPHSNSLTYDHLEIAIRKLL